MDSFSILNYQGSKKNLLDFIHTNTNNYINSSTTILDIFAGSCSVGYSFKKQNQVYANDSEYYAYIISTALLSNYKNFNLENILSKILLKYDENMLRQKNIYITLSKTEEHLLECNDVNGLIELYEKTPTIWNDNLIFEVKHVCFELFTTYYSNSYFGIKQAMEIDSIRYSFEQYKNEPIYCVLLSSLFYAMKECVFSKDGHMAQPLNLNKNKDKLCKKRKKSIFDAFKNKLGEFLSDIFISTNNINKTFNLNFQDLLKSKEIQEDVQFIYADPPYTDMQYSRYYHLLNVVSNYNYLQPTLIANKPTKGLYLEGRFQSKLSTKSTSFNQFKDLIDFSQSYKKNLAISFAFPKNIKTQKTDRYVMTVDELTLYCQSCFGMRNVDVITKDYLHSNHRNSESKKVLEYLILCNGYKK